MMKKIKPLTLIKCLALALTLQTLSYSTRAAVNMRDASFLSQWKDFDLSTKRGPATDSGVTAEAERFELIRYYNSRSYFVGLFGYGWCTDFEKKITVIAANKIQLHDCKLSAPVEYNLPVSKAPHKRIQLTLGQDLLEFNDKGQMIYMKSPGSPGLALSYDSGGRIKSIQGSNLRRLEFEVSPQMGLIKKVVSKDGSRILSEATYEYENENLISVKAGKLVSQKNMYDKMNNLTRTDEVLDDGSKKFEVVVYDETFDRVKKYLDSKGCLEDFSYMSENAQNTSFVSVVERKCNDQIVARATYRIKDESKKIERSVATSERLK